ncbi:DinB family protein [Saccharopolyspora griseoalba]|uniref:DinB family protein n=1 Tax=Saccharopolyspora griseoalba TaxID=1431848 RepID=A0ABW2LFT4_9PSEU
MPESEPCHRIPRTCCNGTCERPASRCCGSSTARASRPLTPTGTNLLGMVKHLAACEIGYFGATFDRPFPDTPEWLRDLGDDPHVDMWVTADESHEDVVGLAAHADATIGGLPLEGRGVVPWWPEEKREVALHQILVHMIAETNRHAGHADILRESLDGAVGLNEPGDNLPEGGADFWAEHRERVERTAQLFR